LRWLLSPHKPVFFHLVYNPVQWLVRRWSPLPRRTFYAPSQFTWIPGIEAGFRSMRDELLALLERRERIPAFHEVSPDQAAITADDKWKTFVLYVYGEKIAANCLRCPETTRLLEAIPGMRTAFFSILAPGKHIPPHTGPYGGVVRYHLGLVVPRNKECCRIRVGSDHAHWEEGRSVVFDDTYSHEVWNDTDEERAVLFVDFERPAWFPVNLVNSLVIWLIGRSAFVRDMVGGIEEWNRKP
jgi:beta-hydroxylase